MSGAVPQREERIQFRQRRLGQRALHVLGFVQNQHRPRCLNEMNGRFPEKAISRLAKDVGRLVERIDSHDHELDALRECELAYLIDLR